MVPCFQIKFFVFLPLFLITLPTSASDDFTVFIFKEASVDLAKKVQQEISLIEAFNTEKMTYNEKDGSVGYINFQNPQIKHQENAEQAKQFFHKIYTKTHWKNEWYEYHPLIIQFRLLSVEHKIKFLEKVDLYVWYTISLLRFMDYMSTHISDLGDEKTSFQTIHQEKLKSRIQSIQKKMEKENNSSKCSISFSEVKEIKEYLEQTHEIAIRHQKWREAVFGDLKSINTFACQSGKLSTIYDTRLYMIRFFKEQLISNKRMVDDIHSPFVCKMQ